MTGNSLIASSTLKVDYCEKQILDNESRKSIDESTVHKKCTALFKKAQNDRNSSESESSQGIISLSDIADGGLNVQIQLIFTAILAISGFYFLIFSHR
jgi:hypothetical protein